jgi:hypothetical protein
LRVSAAPKYQRPAAPSKLDKKHVRKLGDDYLSKLPRPVAE